MSDVCSIFVRCDSDVVRRLTPASIPRKRVCRISIVQQSRRRELGSTVLHWSLWEKNFVFAAILLILL